MELKSIKNTKLVHGSVASAVKISEIHRILTIYDVMWGANEESDEEHGGYFSFTTTKKTQQIVTGVKFQAMHVRFFFQFDSPFELLKE